MKLLQRDTSTQSRATVRFKDHILKQLITYRILLQLARNAPQMTQRDRSIAPAREELVCVIDLRDHGVVVA